MAMSLRMSTTQPGFYNSCGFNFIQCFHWIKPYFVYFSVELLDAHWRRCPEYANRIYSKSLCFYNIS